MRYLVLIAATLTLASCAANSTYMGISLRSANVDLGLQKLAARAASGDKQAQLQLGIRYEEGTGVPIDLGLARILYMRAAETSGGTVFVYTPPVSGMKNGMTFPVNTGERSAGLEAARKRLENLKPK